MPETLNSLLLDHWAANSAPAIVGSDVTWSGDEFIARAFGAAAWLARHDVRERGAVAAIIDETPDAIALAVGAAFSGRALAPLGTRFPVEQLAAAVRRIGSDVVIASPALQTIASDVAARSGARLLIFDGTEPAGTMDACTDPADVGAVIHTSGTTGDPSPVFMRQDALAARANVYAEVIELGAGDRYCSTSPFYHVAGVGMALVALGVGATVLPCVGFTLDEWQRVAMLAPTHVLVVPTMIDMLLGAGALDGGMRVLQYGAAPIHPDTLNEAMRAMPDTRLIQIFGQTEVSPVAVLSHDDHQRAAHGASSLLSSVGRPPSSLELRLEHDDDDGGVGEVTVRAPHVFAPDPDGWRRTGDLAMVDADGYVYLRGRRLDRIVRGGENIYPIEIETVLGMHPGVADVCVIGVPDRRWGEIVKAVVVPVPGATSIDASELQAYVRERLAHFKVPAVVEFIDALPRTPTGKVLRRALRAG